MGAFFINEDNFNKEQQGGNYSNSKFLWMKNNIKGIYVIFFIFITINIFLFFYFFYKTDSLIEISENKDFKEYCANNVLKDQNIYKLLSHKKETKKTPIVISKPQEEEEIIETFSKGKTVQNGNFDDNDKIIFNNIRSLNIDENKDKFINTSVSQKILDIDNENNSDMNIYRLNVGVFLSHNLAEEFVQKLKKTHQICENMEYYIVPVQFKKKILYKVLLGNFNNELDAESISDKLENSEINNTVEKY